MFYMNSDYSDYKYLVEAHDDFLILSSRSHISGSSGDIDYIPIIYQYLSPSSLTIPSRYYSYDTLTFVDVSSQFSDSIYDRKDFPLIFICGFIILLIFLFVLNNLTKLVHKGGIFGDT